MTGQFDSVSNAARAIQEAARKTFGPPEEGLFSSAQLVLPFSVVRKTRGYIETVINQVNGCYENGWFDACAVMMRRSLETLIIEVYEEHKISDKIMNSNGEFLYLGELIGHMLNETAWNLGRNVKVALPRLKDIGDKSAHSRRFNAHRKDIDNLRDDFRIVIQELVYLAHFK